MTLTQLKKFFKQEHRRMVEHWGKDENQKQRTLYRTIKLAEEIAKIKKSLLV